MLCVPCNRPAQAAEVREFKARVCDSEIVFDNHFGVQGIVKMNLDLPPGFCYLDYNATVSPRSRFFSCDALVHRAMLPNAPPYSLLVSRHSSGTNV